MANVVKCKDLGFDCSFVVKAESEEELLGKVAEHAASAHGITEVTPELVEQVRGVIHTE